MLCGYINYHVGTPKPEHAMTHKLTNDIYYYIDLDLSTINWRSGEG